MEDRSSLCHSTWECKYTRVLIGQTNIKTILVSTFVLHFERSFPPPINPDQ
jgi:hypothetical protein